MVGGIDTSGEIYYSLMQANSDEATMKLFFYKLVKQLDGENPSWRKDTVL